MIRPDRSVIVLDTDLLDRVMDAASMPGWITDRRRSLGTASLLATLIVMTAAPSCAAPRVLADALPPGQRSCHAIVVGAAELASQRDRRVVSVALERTARDLAAERKWRALEQFDDTPVVSATLRVRLRGDPATHAARLECTEGDDGALVCRSAACTGGEIRVVLLGGATISVAVGGALTSGRFFGHYIHLDESCEGRIGGPIVLESGNNDRVFNLPPAPKEACR
jgi:hypothetical protein